MLRKSLLIVLLTLTTTIFSGCAKELVYVDRPVPYAVPVKCTIPKITCDFQGKGAEPVIHLLECIVTQKKAMAVCQNAK